MYTVANLAVALIQLYVQRTFLSRNNLLIHWPILEFYIFHERLPPLQCLDGVFPLPSHYDLKHNDDIVSFFNDFSDHLAEEALWELSLKIKPRNITRRKTEREEKT